MCFIRHLFIALFQLVEHGRQFLAIVPSVGHTRTHDHAAFGVVAN